MEQRDIMKIFEETAYIRTSGTPEELRCAEYLMAKCAELGAEAKLEAFPVAMATMQKAELWADGKQLPCTGYFCSGDAELEAPLYYLNASDPYSLSQCRDKIVMLDSGLGFWTFRDLLAGGALGFITFTGDTRYVTDEIDQKELRGFVSMGDKLPGVNINAKTAVAMVKGNVERVKIVLKQEEYEGESHNVVLDLPGEIEEMIVLSAHYDSTSLSQGAYDNMSGCVGLLGIAEYFMSHPHRYGLRFVWCGSEERGLLGSKAYVAAHEDELRKFALNINLDMIGSVMGAFIAACTTEEALVHYITYMGQELGFPVRASQDVYSSDSTPFADHGVPALSFARVGARNTAGIHDSYDTMALIKPENMVKDIDFLIAFTERMACAVRCPVGRDIPQNMKDKLDIYLNRKRK